MKKAYLLTISLVGLAVLLSVAKAVLQNSLSTSGIYLSKAQQEINYFKTQNAILSEKLLTASSLATIISKASESGFTVGNNMMVIKTSVPLAAKP